MPVYVRYKRGLTCARQKASYRIHIALMHTLIHKEQMMAKYVEIPEEMGFILDDDGW